mmetsp:Transcript_99629/g.284779  ORF Transcript_99629/g.284779 Transcript_99629/m.284779 type:complete len:804 (-) Transcript_99629:251-2662(-)
MAEAACAAKPGDASSHVHLGMLKEDRIDFDGAETAYNAAIAADPGYATCAGLGVIAEDAGNFDAAEAHYRAAIAADPTNSNARFILAGFLEKRAEKSGDLADAAMIYDECAQLYTVSDGVDCELTRSVQQKAHTARMTVWCDEVRPSGASQCLGLLHGEDEYTSEQAAYMLSFARRRGGSLKFLPPDDAPRIFTIGEHEKHERYKRYRHITTFEEVDAALKTTLTCDFTYTVRNFASTIDIDGIGHYSGCLMESDDLVHDVASWRCTLFEPAPVAGQDKEEDTDSEGGETSRHKLRLPREIYPMQREVKTTGSALDLRANKKAVQALGLPPVQLAGAHPFVVPVRFQRLHLRMRVADAELNGLGSNPLAKTTRQFRLWAGRVGFNVHAEMSDKGRALRQHPNAGGIVAVCSVNSLRERPYIPGTSVTDTWIDSLRDPGYLDDWHTREPSQWALSSQRVVEAKRWLDLPDVEATPTLSSRQVEQLLIRFDHQNDETVRKTTKDFVERFGCAFGTRPWDYAGSELCGPDAWLRDVHWADVMSCDNALAKIAEELDAAATHVERGTFIPTGPRSIVVSTSDCTKAVEHWFAVTYDIDRKGEEELAALDIGPAVTSMEATPAPSSATPPSKAQVRVSGVSRIPVRQNAPYPHCRSHLLRVESDRVKAPTCGSGRNLLLQSRGRPSFAIFEVARPSSTTISSVWSQDAAIARQREKKATTKPRTWSFGRPLTAWVMSRPSSNIRGETPGLFGNTCTVATSKSSSFCKRRAIAPPSTKTALRMRLASGTRRRASRWIWRSRGRPRWMRD